MDVPVWMQEKTEMKKYVKDSCHALLIFIIALCTLKICQYHGNDFDDFQIANLYAALMKFFSFVIFL